MAAAEKTEYVPVEFTGDTKPACLITGAGGFIGSHLAKKLKVSEPLLLSIILLHYETYFRPMDTMSSRRIGSEMSTSRKATFAMNSVSSTFESSKIVSR